MQILNTEIEGVVIIQPAVFSDDRGYFFQSYHDDSFKQKVCNSNFVQDNESKSDRGVLRGLHFQTGQYAQAKLVRVVKGAVLDVVVDLRKDSNTFGKHQTFQLSEANKRQLFVPRGFAHGFIALKNETIFHYKCDNYYSPKHERGIIWNDPVLAIDWAIDQSIIKVSLKDQVLPSFDELVKEMRKIK